MAQISEGTGRGFWPGPLPARAKDKICVKDSSCWSSLTAYNLAIKTRWGIWPGAVPTTALLEHHTHKRPGIQSFPVRPLQGPLKGPLKGFERPLQKTLKTFTRPSKYPSWAFEQGLQKAFKKSFEKAFKRSLANRSRDSSQEKPEQR